MTDLVPAPHSWYVAQVCDLVGRDSLSLRDRISRRARLSNSYATRLVEDPAIICIAGERGSGKTTVLSAAAAQLSAEGHLVIPPVRPEFFAAAGSLIPSVVAHLRTTLREDWPVKGGKGSDAEIRINRKIDRTLRQANLISYGSARESSQLRADEQAADLSLAAYADSDFLDNWRELTAQVRARVAKTSKGSKDAVIVIPVDDPDLSPGTLHQILLDLRLITSVDGVVGIACLDLEEARSELADAYRRSYKQSPSRLLTSRVVDAQIAKAFPDDSRVSIGGLDTEDRLSFKALDLPLPSIEKLCSGYAIGEHHRRDTVASVLRLPRTKSPSPYARALPSNPRDLRALAYRLSTIPSDSPTSVGQVALELCRIAVETGLKQSGATDPELWPAGKPFEVLDPIDDLPNCAVRYDEIAIRAVAHGQHDLPGSKDDDGSMLIKVGFDSGVEAHLVRRGDKAETIQRLDPSLTYALLLIREFSHYYGVFHVNISGSTPVRGGDRSSSLMLVRLDGKPTDSRFLTAPAWEAFYDYFVLDEALRDLVSNGTAPHNLTDRRLVIEAYFIDFCRNIVSVQMQRTPARDPSRVSTAVRAEGSAHARRLLDRELSKLFREFEKCLDSEESRVHGADGIRGDDFWEWIEVGIANMCHDRLLTPHFIEKLMSHRSRTLDKRGRLQAANTALSASLESRIKASIDERWVSSLIELVHGLDEELGVILLASHRAALETVERGRRRLLGEAAITTHSEIPQAEGVDADFKVALAALEQIESEARSAALG